jgi:hypothetical protein
MKHRLDSLEETYKQDRLKSRESENPSIESGNQSKNEDKEYVHQIKIR